MGVLVMKSGSKNEKEGYIKILGVYVKRNRLFNREISKEEREKILETIKKVSEEAIGIIEKKLSEEYKYFNVNDFLNDISVFSGTYESYIESELKEDYIDIEEKTPEQVAEYYCGEIVENDYLEIYKNKKGV